MRTIDRIHMRAPVERVFQAATDVEQWPGILGHYRWVHMLEHQSDGGLVEMAAWRPFGRLKYPTWWVSEMWIDRATARRCIIGTCGESRRAWMWSGNSSRRTEAPR